MAKKHLTKSKPRQQKPAQKRPSTALVRRQSAAPAIQLLRPVTDIESRASRDLTENIALGELGLLELKLTPEEELVLSEPVPINDVLVKPVKHPQPYLSHPSYSRWFNRAFGRLGWAIVPASRPLLHDGSVVCPYVLHIHGRPVAFAMGEQEYHANNPEQTYGDALESTIASALRRCAKRLGVGLELWDRQWLDAFVAEHCIKVKVDKSEGKFAWIWRRRRDKPFWNEVRVGAEGSRERVVRDERPQGPWQAPSPQRSAPAARQMPPTAPVNGSGPVSPKDVITEAQRRKLWAALKSSGRSEMDLRGWLESRYGLTSTKYISKASFNEIITAIEAPGSLPSARTPGEDG